MLQVSGICLKKVLENKIQKLLSSLSWIVTEIINRRLCKNSNNMECIMNTANQAAMRNRNSDVLSCVFDIITLMPHLLTTNTYLDL